MERTGPGLLGVLLLATLAAAEAPWIQPIPDWVIEEDATLTVGVVVEDPDSNDLLYWVEADSPYLVVNFDEENMQVNCQPAANWFGTANVTVGVDDLDEARTLTTEEFRVEVESVNDCPRRLPNVPATPFAGPEDQCLELSWAQLTACFTDADWAWVPGSLSFQNPVFSAGTVETTATGLRLCAPANWNGNATLSVHATDGLCGVTTSLPIKINAVNDCPVQVAAWQPVNGLEDTELVVSGLLDAFQDVDGNSLTFCILDGMDGFESRWGRTGVLTLTPPAEMSGQWSLFICITDGVCQTGAFLDISLAAVNDAPALPSTHALSLMEDGSLVAAYPVSDVDSPQVYVQASSSDPGLSVAWSAALGLQLLPAPDWNGQAVVTVTACDAPDGGGACRTSQITVTVAPVNDAPVLETLADVQVDEDGRLELQPDFHDVDSASLEVVVACAQPLLGAQWHDESGLLVVEPAADWHGQATVEVTVSDGQGGTAQRSFLVEVLPVNDAPVQPAAVALELDEDGSLALPWPVTDVDGPQLAVTVASDQAGLAGAWQAGQLTLTAMDDWNGQALLSVTACDGGQPQACVTRQLAVTVHAVNDAPVLAGLVDVEFPEDGLWEQELDVSDIDSEATWVTATSDAAGLAAQWLDGLLRLVPQPDWHGQAVVTVVVSDEASRALAQGQFTATVAPVNDAPVQPAAVALELDEDGSLALPWPVTDVDGPQLAVTVASDQAGLAGAWQAGQLTLTALSDWNGQALLSVTACDGDNPQACVTRQLPVTVLAVNDAPVLPAQEPVSLPEDGELLVELGAADVDGPDLVVAVESDTSALAATWLPESGRLRLVPAADWNGTAVLQLAACDLHPQNPLCASGQLVVHVGAVNDAPVLDELADRAMAEDGVLLVAVSAQDVESQDLVFAASCDRSEVAVEWLEASGQLRLAPQADWHGQALVTVTVSDEAERLLDSAAFTLTVDPVNDAPVLADPGPQSLAEDGELLVSLSLSDVDGPELAVTVGCDTPQLTATWLSESGALRLQPAADWQGSALVTVTVCDLDPGQPLCASREIAVEVLGVNDAPTIGEVADQEMDEDGQLALPLVLSDVDGSELVLSWSAEPAVLAAVFHEEEALLELAPAADWHGATTVTLSLDDQQGRAVATRQFTVTVRPVNDAPHVLPCAEWSCGLVEDPQAFRQWLLGGGATADLADVDGDALELVWFVDGVEVSRHALGSAVDTLDCQVLPAPAEEVLAGHVVLHAELTDGTVSLNPGGETCAWELDFTGLDRQLPTELALDAAWPNPFNPSTVLPFALARAGEARLTVYDLRGAQVAVLVDGWHAAGRHQVRWEAGGLASGVYLAVLESDGENRVRRLTLLK